ncbi:NeuD/PglB/VioB family sugar acetyltransferase [Microvirga guangxiensis]|uniref:Sugar O-acyltransferase, sialic acid O-acetyltransferase NeuD family n=1 Tax=Microvirga guangxiensis TaxID=549386 RepID=A0A1G5LQR4_9HYPH|nr:NeuD/PglB/VioB family sugar acetyltransferase [Microvirga guangxiensis]SCZ14499.1 sugar O-acyltransferase, sialic acid O-acetyltransferase NeuD family [Microvirga guangxiensis]
MPKDILVGLFGAGGYAREVMPYVAAASKHLEGDLERTAKFCFVEKAPSAFELNGYSVLSEEDFFASEADLYFNVAIADSRLRERIAARCASEGAHPIDLRADNVVVMDQVTIGDGQILSPFVTLTSNIHIGRFFHANIYSYVAHDCKIGDFVTFAPGVKCNGNVVIEDHAYIGTGAIIRPGSSSKPLVIGTGAIVGMGAVVTKNVEPGTTVVGNPARPFVR